MIYDDLKKICDKIKEDFADKKLYGQVQYIVFGVLNEVLDKADLYFQDEAKRIKNTKDDREVNIIDLEDPEFDYTHR